MTAVDPQQVVGLLQAVVQRIGLIGDGGEQRERASNRERSINESPRHVAKAEDSLRPALAFGRRGP